MHTSSAPSTPSTPSPLAHLVSAKWCAWYHGLDEAALERLKAAILEVDIGTKVTKNDEASNREDGAVVFAIQFFGTCASCVVCCVLCVFIVRCALRLWGAGGRRH